MNTSRTYKGIFWIAGEYENHKNGLLKFLNGIAYIELFGSFDKDPFDIKTKRRDKICCIYGILDNSQCCILNDCNLRITNPFGIIVTEIDFHLLYYSSNQNLIKKKTEFNKVLFKIDTLFDWVGNTAIESVRQDGSLNLIHNKPKDINVLFSNDQYRLSLSHATVIPITTNKKSITIEQDNNLILDIYNEKTTISELFIFINRIQDLFILINADKVELDRTIELSEKEDKGYFGYFCYNNYNRFTNHRRNVYTSSLFTLKEIEERIDLSIFFTTWINLYKGYAHPIELFIKCLSDIEMNSQHKFINLVYCLDVIQQKEQVTKTIAKIDLTEKNQRIIEKLKTEFNVDNNTINSLISQLSKQTTPNLKSKIGALLMPYSGVFTELFGQSIEDFVEIIINTRNFLAHESSTEPRLTIDGYDNYNSKLEAILILMFFSKLGLEIDLTAREIKSHVRFNKVLH